MFKKKGINKPLLRLLWELDIVFHRKHVCKLWMQHAITNVLTLMSLKFQVITTGRSGISLSFIHFQSRDGKAFVSNGRWPSLGLVLFITRGRWYCRVQARSTTDFHGETVVRSAIKCSTWQKNDNKEFSCSILNLLLKTHPTGRSCSPLSSLLT